VNLVQGGLIETADYNDIALEINRLFSDNTVGLVYSTSDLLLNTTLASPLGTNVPVDLSSNPLETDFLVVIVDTGSGFETLQSSNGDYTINYIADPVTIQFPILYAAGTSIRVYNRTDHRYGWGQQASVTPVVVGNLVYADEPDLQAYIEANTNNLIDKINIAEERIGGPSEFSRISPSSLIRATDITSLRDAINTEILTLDNYWKNVIATTINPVESFTRDLDWDNILIGEMRHTWSSYNSMRYFFNSGGELRANIALTGDPDNQGFYNWNLVANQMGELIVNFDTTFQSGTGGISEQIGAYELTDTYQLLFTSTSPSAPVAPGGEYDEYSDFTDLVIRWEGRIFENTPSAGEVSIDIRVTLDDVNLNTTTEGTTTYNGGYKIADSITENSAVFDMTSNAPTLSILNDFESGDDS